MPALEKKCYSIPSVNLMTSFIYKYLTKIAGLSKENGNMEEKAP